MAALLFFPLPTSSAVLTVKACPSSSARSLSWKTQCLLLDRHQEHKGRLSSTSRSFPRFWLVERKKDGGRRRSGEAAAMGWTCSAAYLRPETVQWVCSVSAVALMFARGTAIQKQFLVPLFALQAPQRVVEWMRQRGEYGIWSAFLALLVRLFYFIPGELELPFITLLLVIAAPYQAANLRGTQAGAIVSLVIAAYMAYQHFSRLGSLQKAFDQGSIIPTLAILGIASVLCLFFF